MPSSDGVTLAAEVLREVAFHLAGRLVGHRVQINKELRQEAPPEAADVGRGFVTVEVI